MNFLIFIPKCPKSLLGFILHFSFGMQLVKLDLPILLLILLFTSIE